MNIEIEHNYICRNGKLAYIEQEISKIDKIYTFKGYVFNEGGEVDRLAMWMQGGRYNIDLESEYDIISELNEYCTFCGKSGCNGKCY